MITETNEPKDTITTSQPLELHHMNLFYQLRWLVCIVIVDDLHHYLPLKIKVT